MKIQNQTKAYLFGLSAVLCWSTVATAFKLSLASLTPAQLVLFASLTSSVVLGITLIIQNKLSLFHKLSARDYLNAFLFGLLNPVAYYLTLFKAYDLLRAQEAQAINYSWALMLSLLAVPILGHRLGKRDITAVLVCYFGVLIIATQGNVFGLNFTDVTDVTGVILALLSTFLWALYWVLNTKDQGDPVLGLFLKFSLALPVIFVYCFVVGELDHIAWDKLYGPVYIGIFEMSFAFVLWLTALKYTNSVAKISNLIFIAPFLSLFFISTYLQEKILISTYYGLGLIILGLVIQQVSLKSLRKLVVFNH